MAGKGARNFLSWQPAKGECDCRQDPEHSRRIRAARRMTSSKVRPFSFWKVEQTFKKWIWWRYIISRAMYQAMKNDIRLHVTEHLLTLERGRNELLLANYLDLRPLYIKEGRKYIKQFLKAASELGTYNKIIEAFPNDISLLDMLVDHGIIIPGGSTQNNTFQMPQEELRFDNRRSISLYLLISQSCNMGCIYCLNGTKTYQKDKDLMMSQEIAFESIERCLDGLCPQGYLEVIFFGGEPLLNWPLAKEIIIYCENALRQ